MTRANGGERGGDREPEARAPRDDGPRTPRGLCPDCVHVQRITSERGSTFLLCRLSKVDARFPRYPPQPRMVCPGFAG